MTYDCPNVLPNVPNMKCEIKFGQIQKVAFQRLGQSFTREEIISKAGWSAFLTSQTPSKIVVTPFVEAPTSDGGDERTFGSGNQVLDGIEIIMGINPVKMTFALRHYPQIIIEALKHLMQFRDLGVFFFTGDGRIIALKEDNLYKAIPIRSLCWRPPLWWSHSARQKPNEFLLQVQLLRPPCIDSARVQPDGTYEYQ